MIHISSVFDKNYLALAIALVDSIKRTYGEDFEFHCLCLDDESLKVIGENFPQAITYKCSELEDEELRSAKKDRPYNEYCWTLASWFSNYLLTRLEMPHIIYIDADIWFVDDSKDFFKECLEKSVGIMRHRHIPPGHPDGGYNVGVVSFRNDKVGIRTLSWWKDAVLKKEPRDLATCGDQKFLEAFPNIAKTENIKILDENFSYGAPWTYRLYGWSNFFNTGKVLWGDKEQPLVFVHFSRIGINTETKEVTNVTDPQFSVHTLNDGVFSIPEVAWLYYQYRDTVLKIIQDYKLYAK